MTRTAVPCAALAALLCAATPAGAATPPCLTRTELEAVVTVLSPTMVRRTAARCRPSLAAEAYLPRSGDALAARLEPRVATAMPAARATLLRMASIPIPVGDAAMLTMIGRAIDSELLAKLAPADCERIDRLLAHLDALPPADFEGAIVAISEMGLAQEDADVRLCPVAPPL